MATEGLLSYDQAYILPGNVLDVVVLEPRASVIVSIDIVHEAGSMEKIRSPEDQEAIDQLHVISFDAISERDNVVNAGELASIVGKISNNSSPSQHRKEEDMVREQKELGELLYGVEHLRKRGPDG